MNVRLLIDGIVRQTMVLIAQLATSGGLRAPLAHVAGQAFLELAKELQTQGVSKKVSADMFGMALRTYQRRMQRLGQSHTDSGRSLWEAVLEHIEQHGVIGREQVFARFRRDDEASLRGVLRDLVESGLVFCSGAGRGALYRALTRDELGTAHQAGDRVGLEAFVWSLVYREGSPTRERLLEVSGVAAAELDVVLQGLLASGRVEREVANGTEVFLSRSLVLGMEDPAGWEASVLDHFSTLVRTVSSKLAVDQRASLGDEIGGSTYHFALWRGHPLEAEVVGELRRFRERMSALRQRLDEHNEAHAAEGPGFAVHAYYGQYVLEDADVEDGKDEE